MLSALKSSLLATEGRGLKSGQTTIFAGLKYYYLYTQNNTVATHGSLRSEATSRGGGGARVFCKCIPVLYYITFILMIGKRVFFARTPPPPLPYDPRHCSDADSVDAPGKGLVALVDANRDGFVSGSEVLLLFRTRITTCYSYRVETGPYFVPG